MPNLAKVSVLENPNRIPYVYTVKTADMQKGVLAKRLTLSEIYADQNKAQPSVYWLITVYTNETTCIDKTTTVFVCKRVANAETDYVQATHPDPEIYDWASTFSESLAKDDTTSYKVYFKPIAETSPVKWDVIIEGVQA